MHPFSLTFSHWNELDGELTRRRQRLETGNRALKDFDRSNSFQIAATDLFVEKAQIHLTITAHVYTCVGTALALLSFMSLAAVIWIIAKTDITQIVPSPAVPSWQIVVLYILRAAGLAGFVGAAVYFSASLSRAFFHEATVLFNRRHALRFGRLYVYLKYGESLDERKTLEKTIASEITRIAPIDYSARESVGEESTGTGESEFPLPRVHADLMAYLIHRDVRAEDLERAFGWNLQMHTGFRDIRPEAMTASIYGRALDVLSKVVERIGKLRSRGSLSVED